MKKKFTRILGVSVTLVLLVSLGLFAAPVSALSQPIVTFDTDEDAVISEVDAHYIISFRVDEQLVAGDKIAVTFPEGTAVEASPTVTIKGWILDGGIGGTLTEDFVDAEVASRVDDTLEVELTWSTDAITTLGTVVVEFTAGITNPDDADDYNLTVGTQDTNDDVIEAAVTSAAYEITAPIIPVLAGIVQQFNAADILMAQATGADAINTLVASAGENYTIVVGPGEYAIDATIDLDEEGLILKSSGDAEDTIIKDGSGLTSHLILISAAEVTVDGFTIGDVYAYHHGISIQGNDAIVKNNIITAEPTEIGIFINASGATVTGNELDENCTMYLCAVSDSTISDNIFGECLNLYPGALAIDGLTLTDNTMIGSLAQAIDFEAGKTFNDILIEGNIISEAEGTAAIQIRDADNITKLQILNNDITDNEGDGILIGAGAWSATNVIKFNTITGNDSDTADYGIQNDSTADVDATFNWWGTDVAADIADMVSGATKAVTYDPFLAGTAEDVLSVSDVATVEDSLDAKTTVGVRVSVVDKDGAPEAATVISVVRYTANPEEAIADAIAFYDVYVVGTAVPITDVVTIKFYTGDENTEVYLWSADTDVWVEVTPVGFSEYGGYVYVTVDADLLGGTPFALVGGVAAVEVGTVTVNAPTAGATGLPITNVPFTWTAVDDAEYYMVVVSANADLTTLVASEEAAGTAYTYSGTLDYSTPYYYQITAMKGISEVVARSDVGAFLTMAEPVEPTAPVVVQQAPAVELPDIVIPAAEMVTPAWLYAVIAIAAVLVIAVIVLIVRTRRVS